MMVRGGISVGGLAHFFFLILSRSIANLLFDWNGWLNRWLGTEDLELGGTTVREMKTPKTWLHVPMCSQSDGERKTWDQRLICVISLVKEQWDLVFFFFFCLNCEKKECSFFVFCFVEEKERMKFILVRKLCEKNLAMDQWTWVLEWLWYHVENLNLMIMEYKSKWEREWRLGLFTWFGYVSLHPQDVANGLHLYYILSV